MRTILVVAFAIFLTACQAPRPDEASQQQREIEQAIDQQWVGYKETALNGDAEGFCSYWTMNLRYWGPGMDLDRQEFESLVANSFESGIVYTAVKFEPFETFVHGNVVYQIGQLDESYQLPTGESIEEHNFMLARWEKQDDGGWKITHGMSSPVSAPPQD